MSWRLFVHEDWFPVNYLAVVVLFSSFISGVGFDQGSGVAIIVSLLFAMAGFRSLVEGAC